MAGYRSEIIYTPPMMANWAKVLGKAQARQEGDEPMWSIDLLGDPNDEEIAKLMRDADPDGSGQIEFEEFVTVMRSQMDKGGGLADVVAAAGNLFGWLNVGSWFGK